MNAPAHKCSPTELWIIISDQYGDHYLVPLDKYLRDCDEASLQLDSIKQQKAMVPQ